MKSDAVFIDTRTPEEFEDAHIPNAINIPLFSSEERANIGKIYAKIGKEEAVDKGIELVSPKLQGMIKKYSKYKNKKLIVYCWRGGMRSKSIVALLNSLGYNAFQLDGGHKAYRNYVLEKLNNFDFKPKLIALYGLTGVGKTELLKLLEPRLDLEGIAQHRSSLFGSVNLKPRNQKMFDCLLLQELEKLNNEKLVFIEGESRKIGSVQMPPWLWFLMNKSIKIRIECSLINRVNRIIKEYVKDKGSIEQIRKVVQSLKQRLGSDKVFSLLQLLDKKDYEMVTEILLLDYYDPLYRHTVESHKYETVINNDKLNLAIEQINKFVNHMRC